MDPTVKNGIYKIPAAGGAVATPWAGDPGMNFPNGLIFDAKGNLFVADSGGTIFEIDTNGTVSTWAIPSCCTRRWLASGGSRIGSSGSTR